MSTVESLRRGLPLPKGGAEASWSIAAGEAARVARIGTFGARDERRCSVADATRPRAMLAQPRRRSTDDAAVAACQDARLSRLRTAALSLRCAARHHAWRDGDAAHAWPAGCATPGSTVKTCRTLSRSRYPPERQFWRQTRLL
jgi:hypothetical protein